jgi:bifunctional ADP-heptose synthase (sugar kinase/adenylyltransferase)
VKVLAVVDLVADEYIVGQISRVSREAPVLILDYDEPHRARRGRTP